MNKWGGEAPPKFIGKDKKLIARVYVIVLLSAATFTMPSFAGDFSNPVPYSVETQRASRIANEHMRLFGGSSGSGPLAYGDYYERYQSGTNWNNAVQSGNTIILNGDNNSVVLTLGDATITQTSNNACLSTSNTFLNDGGTAETQTVNCGISE